jgi:hypothetical protein
MSWVNKDLEDDIICAGNNAPNTFYTKRKKAWVGGMTAAFVLNLDLTSEERSSGVLCTGSWMDPRGCLDALEKRKLSCHYGESK